MSITSPKVTKEFMIAGFTGGLKVWYTKDGARHVFREPLPVVKDKGYVFLLDGNGQGKMLIVNPPPYLPGLK